MERWHYQVIGEIHSFKRLKINLIFKLGGMVDAGENVSATLKREFIEEALNGKVDDELIDGFFKNTHEEIYRGYVDDPRNTGDNNN